MADTNRLVLPLLSASQAQKHVTVNEALKLLDAIIQAGVIDKDLTAPPGSPSEGDIYIVGASATGTWATHDDDFAIYQDGAWVFVTPLAGWIAFVVDETTLYVYNSGWSSLAGILGASYLPLSGGTLTGDLALEEASPSIRFGDTDINGDTLLQTVGAKFQISVDYNNVDASSSWTVAIDGIDKIEANQYGFGVGGASADANNQLAVFGTAALFNSSGSFTFKFNKNAAANDAALSFQTGFTAYALVGLLGDNNWTVKVGTGATTAIKAYESTGAVELTQHPKFAGYCNYDQYNAAGAWFTVDINNLDHNDQSAVSSGVFTAPHAGYYSFTGMVRHLTNGTVPTVMSMGFSINGAAPLARHQVRTDNGGTITDNTVLTHTVVLKLAASDTVELQAFFTTNDAYIDADNNYFAGHQIP